MKEEHDSVFGVYPSKKKKKFLVEVQSSQGDTTVKEPSLKVVKLATVSRHTSVAAEWCCRVNLKGFDAQAGSRGMEESRGMWGGGGDNVKAWNINPWLNTLA